MGSHVDDSTQTERSRTAAIAFYNFIAVRDFTGLATLFNPNGNFWISGSQPLVPWSGPMNALERVASLPIMMNNFEDFKVESRAILADGPQAMLEFMVQAKEPGDAGLRYRNEVVMIFRVDEDGLIINLREYLDNMQPLAYLAAREAKS